MLAPQQQQWEFEDRSEGNTNTMSVGNLFDHSKNMSVNHDLSLFPHEIEFSTERMTKSEWYNHLPSLNTKQSQTHHQFTVYWCTKMILLHKCVQPNPLHIYLSGGDVGKSHLVRAIVQTINFLA